MRTANSLFIFLISLFPLGVYAIPPHSMDQSWFCSLYDIEVTGALRKPLPASKRASLNTGKDRTVRLIYFRPYDRPYRSDIVNETKKLILEIQTFFGEQMQAHGYGYKTFQIETDVSGRPVVHSMVGQYSDKHYLNQDTYESVVAEIWQKYDLEANVYLIVFDNSAGSDSRGSVGVGTRLGKNGGVALVASPVILDVFGTSVVADNIWYVMAHELGHAFGLYHDFRHDNYIMSYGKRSLQTSLSTCNVEYLAVHPYFNSRIPSIETRGPTIELVSPSGYPTSSKIVPVRLKVSDSDGLHQVILFVKTRDPHFAAGSDEVKACRELDGERNTIVEFHYDGVIPSDGSTTLEDSDTHLIIVEAVDVKGNDRRETFSLFDILTQSGLITSLEGHTSLIWSVAFSPDGKTLASGSGDGKIKLWDITTRTNIATLNGRDFGIQYYIQPHQIYSVLFSPNGKVLASSGGLGVVVLWNVTTKQVIASFRNRGTALSSVYSPDGKILAITSSYVINLWDVKTLTNIATLEGHTGLIRDLAFSPDGKILASGAQDGTVRLWDITRKRTIAILDRHNRTAHSVVFSPDGKTLASGDWHHIRLWDIETKQQIAVFTASPYSADCLTYSPDGTLLASAAWRQIRLWDVKTLTNIASFSGHTDEIQTIAYSPDGKILASGSSDDTIKLWDVSLYTTPPTPKADFDGDGRVDIGDFLLFVNHFGLSQEDTGYNARFDLDGDGVIGVSDFLIFVDNFGN